MSLQRPKNNPDAPAKKLEQAKRKAVSALTSYKVNAVYEQLQIASKMVDDMKLPPKQSASYKLLFTKVRQTQVKIEQELLNDKIKKGTTRVQVLESATRSLKELTKEFFNTVKTLERRNKIKPKERMIAAEKAANLALSNYKTKAIREQLKIAKVAVQSFLLRDVRQAHLILESKIQEKDYAGATELEAHTAHLNSIIMKFSRAVRNAEKYHDKWKLKTPARLSSAKESAALALKNYEKNGLRQQLAVAKGKVNRNILRDVLRAYTILEDSFNQNKYKTATELEAYVNHLNIVIKKFNTAVKKAEDKQRDQAALEHLEQHFS